MRHASPTPNGLRRGTAKWVKSATLRVTTLSWCSFAMAAFIEAMRLHLNHGPAAGSAARRHKRFCAGLWSQQQLLEAGPGGSLQASPLLDRHEARLGVLHGPDRYYAPAYGRQQAMVRPSTPQPMGIAQSLKQREISQPTKSATEFLVAAGCLQQTSTR